MDTINLKAYLANIGMTMRQFCRKIDCNPEYMSRLASGRYPCGTRLARDVYHATDGIVKLNTKPKKSKVKNAEKQESS